MDIYTNKSAMGFNVSGGTFHPGNELVLYANVTYNGDGVAGVLVSYEVMNSLNHDLVCSTAIADFYGIAKINFTIPAASPEEIFGTWTVIATTSLAQIFASDRLTFQVLEDHHFIPGDINGDGIVDINDATLVVMW